MPARAASTACAWGSSAIGSPEKTVVKAAMPGISEAAVHDANRAANQGIQRARRNTERIEARRL
jgi:hypothetical protein